MSATYPLKYTHHLLKKRTLVPLVDEAVEAGTQTMSDVMNMDRPRFNALTSASRIEWLMTGDTAIEWKHT